MSLVVGARDALCFEIALEFACAERFGKIFCY